MLVNRHNDILRLLAQRDVMQLLYTHLYAVTAASSRAVPSKLNHWVPDSARDPTACIITLMLYIQ